jgi:hypothetical protein
VSSRIAHKGGRASGIEVKRDCKPLDENSNGGRPMTFVYSVVSVHFVVKNVSYTLCSARTFVKVRRGNVLYIFFRFLSVVIRCSALSHKLFLTALSPGTSGRWSNILAA